MQPEWRLVHGPPRDGAMNMALDSTLQHLMTDTSAHPVLHIYEWVPDAVSLGRMQKIEASVDVEACEEDCIQVVRRPTGGRAVLHGRDFTFSIIARADGIIGRTVAESYRLLARVTARTLRAFGVSASVSPSTPPGSNRNACFASATIADLTIDGRKIVGSAQRWEGSVLLQQSSLLYVADDERAVRYIRPGRSQTPSGALTELRKRTVALSDVLDRLPTREAVATALAGALGAELGVRVRHDDFTDDELSLAAKRALLLPTTER